MPLCQHCTEPVSLKGQTEAEKLRLNETQKLMEGSAGPKLIRSFEGQKYTGCTKASTIKRRWYSRGFTKKERNGKEKIYKRYLPKEPKSGKEEIGSRDTRLALRNTLTMRPKEIRSIEKKTGDEEKPCYPIRRRSLLPLPETHLPSINFIDILPTFLDVKSRHSNSKTRSLSTSKTIFPLSR